MLSLLPSKTKVASLQAIEEQDLRTAEAHLGHLAADGVHEPLADQVRSPLGHPRRGLLLELQIGKQKPTSVPS